jgi:multicomponent Na+:H+ antiporter subunit E
VTRRTRLARAVGLAAWAYLTWLLLTWTATAEQLLVGAVTALVVGAALAGLGPVVAPWQLLAPRRVWPLGRLAGSAAGRVARANVALAIRIWRPSLPLRSGMIVLPTRARTDGELAATALITSLIVDNQIVDLDRSRDELQYHAVAIPPGSREERAESVNAPVERLVAAVARA